MDNGKKDQFEGKVKEVGGKLQQGAGDLTGDEQLRAEGETNEAEGKGQGFLGKVKDVASDVANTAKGAAEAVVDKFNGHDKTDTTHS